jgi:hypothetical protein
LPRSRCSRSSSAPSGRSRRDTHRQPAARGLTRPAWPGGQIPELTEARRCLGGSERCSGHRRGRHEAAAVGEAFRSSTAFTTLCDASRPAWAECERRAPRLHRPNARGGTMQDLIAGFSERSAPPKSCRMQSLDAKGAIELTDAVAVYRTEDGRLRVDRSVEVTRKRRAGGTDWRDAGQRDRRASTAGASVAAAATRSVSEHSASGPPARPLQAPTRRSGKPGTACLRSSCSRRVAWCSLETRPSSRWCGATRIHSQSPSTSKATGGTVLRTTLVSAKAARLQKTIAARTEPLA